MILLKIFFFICAIWLRLDQVYAWNKYEDSVFSICFLELKRSTLESSEERGEVRKLTFKSIISAGTAFYIGDNRFITSYHVMEESSLGDSSTVVVIKHKNKDIYIDKIIQYNAVFDLAVLHSSSLGVKDLIPLEIVDTELPEHGDKIVAFDYRDDLLVEIKVPLRSFFLRINQKNPLIVRGVQGADGMSGSPLLYKNKVIGILESSLFYRKVTFFSSSLDLSILLNRPSMDRIITKNND